MQPSARGPEPGRTALPDVLPVLPVRETVVFPLTVAPVLVGLPASVKLVQDAAGGDRLVVLVAQREDAAQPARPEDLHRYGTAAMMHETIRAQDGALRIAVRGIERVRIVDFVQTAPYFVARVQPAPDTIDDGLELDALVRTARERFARLAAVSGGASDQVTAVVARASDPRQLAYLLASMTPMTVGAREEILEIDGVRGKLRRLVEHLQHEINVRGLVNRITEETSTEMTRAQREAVLRGQLETIRRELGEEEAETREARELRERVEALPMPEAARQEVGRELDRLERTPALSPEHGMIRSYLDWVVKLPWGKATGVPPDAARARAVLDEDHFDLDRVKDRIVEHLAVRRLRTERGLDGAEANAREPILCFVGPPGVGKTSLGQSIARAMARAFVRVSLGGVHDEAEIRGHRRTYVGAMPGRVLQALARAGAADPVFMLDEVDKLGVGFHGDPSAALLEVLDPAQNHAFVDTYLGAPFDLSRVLFVCTANTTDTIPRALLDRMELLPLSGYTDADKLAIARRHLLPKLVPAHGLRPDEIAVGDDAVLRIVREYTREAGVRGLERELASVVRKIARRIVEGGAAPVRVGGRDVPDYLGPRRFYDEAAERIDRPGVATGLAWTPVGGDLLFVEATMMPADEERLVLTGMLGDVMRESAQTALSYLRSNAPRFGIDPAVFQHKLVHVHVPAGAIPKDGPSAGVTILSALASQASRRPVRPDLAMTGEVTLRGRVLPVGGIKEKVLAAHRAGVRAVMLPARNEAAVEEIPAEVRRAIDFVFVESAEQALEVAIGPAESQPLLAPPAPPIH